MDLTEEAARILMRGIRRTQRIQVFVAALAAGTGALMIAVHALELDPDLKNMPFIGIVALYGFGILFFGVGAGLLFAAAFRTGPQTMALVDALRQAPEQIHRARRLVARPGGRQNVESTEEREIGAHQLEVVVDGRVIHLMLEPGDVSAVLHAVRQRCPHAEVRGL